jgi:hypothetical protein
VFANAPATTKISSLPISAGRYIGGLMPSFSARLASRMKSHREHVVPLQQGGDTTCAYRLCHPNVVPMETAEPSD